jgi:hypothetical protein
MVFANAKKNLNRCFNELTFLVPLKSLFKTYFAESA